MKYRYYKDRGLEDENSKQIIILLCVNCTKKFRDEAGKLLAEKLNEKEATK